MRLFEGTPWDRPPTCDQCGKPEAECQCPAPTPRRDWADPATQTVRLSLENRKRGKQVSVIRGLSAATTDLGALLTTLKTSLGTGGSLDGDTLELQGDHRDRLQSLLKSMGYRVR